MQQADGQIDGQARFEPDGSVLDRSLPLSLSTIVVVSALALVAGALLRLPALARWALTPEEGAIALAARNLVRGATLPNDMLGQPFVIAWTALFMFLGDTNESVGRVGFAVAGVVAIIAVLALRPLIGALPAAAAALLLAFSPTFITASRSMDGGTLTITLSLLLLAALVRSFQNDGLIYPTLSGVALALLLLSGPVGLPAAILIVVGLYLTNDSSNLPGQRQLVGAAAGFGVAFILFSSALLTQPSSIYEGSNRVAQSLVERAHREHW